MKRRMNGAWVTPTSKRRSGGSWTDSVVYKRVSNQWEAVNEPPVIPDSTALPIFPTVHWAKATTHSSGSAAVTAEVVSRPSEVGAGDLLILYTVMDGGVLADLIPPSGFTSLGKMQATGATDLVLTSVAYKVAQASEPTSYTYGRYSAAADGASLLVAIKNWDGNTSNIKFAQQQTTLAAREVPSVTPTAANSLVLTSAHHDTSAAATWNWIAPSDGVLVGNAANSARWSSIGVSSHLARGTGAVTGLNWAESGITTSSPTQMVTTAVTVGAGTATRTALVGPYTNGSGGALTDQTNLSFAVGGLSHTYHRYASGLDWNKSVGLLIYTDGSGEFGLTNPQFPYLMSGSQGLISVAKRNNMVLLTPMAPGGPCNDGDGVCWYDTSGSTGTTATQKLAWSNALIEYILTRYNIDRSRIAFGGYSSGAQWTTRFWGPGHAHNVVADGVAVPISYGGSPIVANNNTASYKSNVAHVWNCGENDSAMSSSSYGAIGGRNHYQTNGYITQTNIVGGLGHNRYTSGSGGSTGEFGRIMNRAIQEHVRPA